MSTNVSRETSGSERAMQKEAAMNKDEILEKSRRDNDGMDERFKLMQWRAS